VLGVRIPPGLNIKAEPIDERGVMANKIFSFLEETKTELKKVTWPSKIELIGSTAVVLLATLLLAAYIGFFDFLCSITMKLLIR
jgi:preprotein translocase subunit SecE